MSFYKKEFKEWTSSDFMNFLQSIGITPSNDDDYKKIEPRMKSLSASDILSGDAGDIAQEFGISKIKANKIKRELANAKIKCDANNDDEEEGQFSVNVRGLQGRFKTLQKRKFCKTDTIKSVLKQYEDEEGLSGSAKLDSLQILSGNTILQHTKTLGECNIVDNNNLLTIVFKVNGGAYCGKSRSINFKKYNLTKSSLPDILIGYNDDDGIDRALLDCGKHAMTADTMYQYITSSLASNITQKQIYCPDKGCKKELDWQRCTQIADMTFKEYQKWTEIIEGRKNDNVRNCPHCGSLNSRDNGVAIFRVRCAACNKSDWCWECGQVWRGSGLSICGNQNCGIVKQTNEVLSKCKMVKPSHINVEMPEFRACPRCLTLILYSTACKHIRCTGCAKYFCFVCLALQDSNGNYSCGSHVDTCPVAKRQEFK